MRRTIFETVAHEPRMAKGALPGDAGAGEAPQAMRFGPWLAMTTLTLALGGCVRAAGGPATAPAGEAAGVPYFEVTTGGARADERLPMLVVMHGRNGAPEPLVPTFTRLGVRARVVFLRGDPLGHGRATWWREDQYTDGMAVTAAAIARREAQVVEAVGALVRGRPTLGRPVLVGRSQGGVLALAIALRDPDWTSAVFALSSFLPPELFAIPADGGVSRPPIHAFHGDEDERIPIEQARDTVNRLHALGYPIKLTEYEEMGHEVRKVELAILLPEIEQALARQAAAPAR